MVRKISDKDVLAVLNRRQGKTGLEILDSLPAPMTFRWLRGTIDRLVTKGLVEYEDGHDPGTNRPTTTRRFRRYRRAARVKA